MRVLVACERSGVVREAFRAAGHEAWSCDLHPADDGSPFHYSGWDAITLAYDPEEYRYNPVTGMRDRGEWDLLIGHPPCTYLANSGVRWLYKGGRGTVPDPARWESLRHAARFFLDLLTAPIPMVCIENPIMHGHARELGIPEPTQVIQPWQYGHPESKTTALWLRGLPALMPGAVLARPARGYWENQSPGGANRLPPSPERGQLRARTYAGIAAAMAAQWGKPGGPDPFPPGRPVYPRDRRPGDRPRLF
jgi:hypothetical protein